MRFAAFFFMIALLAGCATYKDDPRLQGTWHSDRDATVARTFQRDPRWTNASPEKIQRFKDIFGHLTLTYSNGLLTTIYKGETNSLHYRVTKSGSDFVVMRDDTTLDKGYDIRIRFVDGNASYWTAWPPAYGFGIEEKFDRVTTSTNTGVQPAASTP